MNGKKNIGKNKKQVEEVNRGKMKKKNNNKDLEVYMGKKIHDKRKAHKDRNEGSL